MPEVYFIMLNLIIVSNIKNSGISQILRPFCIYTLFLVVLHCADANSIETGSKPNQDGSGRQPAVLEVRQQSGDQKEIVAVLLQSMYSEAGPASEADGVLLSLPENECGKDDDAFYEKNPKEWIGILYYSPPTGTNESSMNGTDCQSVLERVKKAMLFGASAIIILALNPNILRELDIAQLFMRPLVIVEDVENVTVLLNAIRSKLKLKLRVTTYGASLYDTQTFTIWSACWRARPGSGVVCRFDSGLSKADPNLFWSYFYSALAVIMLLLMLKTNQTQNDFDDIDADQSVRTIARMALSLLKTRRYKKSICNHDDSERDTCAICLDNFQHRQKIRVLPCMHEFHSKCVDKWLLNHQTCPLCKLNIVDLQIQKGIFDEIMYERLNW